jgi:hypothetical protein
MTHSTPCPFAGLVSALASLDLVDLFLKQEAAFMLRVGAQFCSNSKSLMGIM